MGKIITGPAAGQQGAVTIGVTCRHHVPARLHHPGGGRGGPCAAALSRHPGWLRCARVSETANGATSTVTVTVVVDPASQPGYRSHGQGRPRGRDRHLRLREPGSLVVTKTIAGPAAGQQGDVAILVLCGGPTNLFALQIRRRPRPGPVPRSFDGIPAGSTCTVIEVIDGTTETVSVAGVGSGQQVAITPGGVATASLTDTFTAAAAPEATTAPIAEATGTLAVTGAAAQVGRLLDLAVGAIAIGAVMSVMSGRRRIRRPKGHHFKR